MDKETEIKPKWNQLEESVLITPIEPGYSGKAHILNQELMGVINSGRYDEMTVAEISGVLFGLAVQFSK